ncbi:hypothetical protein [Sphingopyxis sp. R3-92]|uniref:hypothetical protein n=1 Tax=Sphingopyxis sp. R3-92 TaxID=3158553 RepID=UPI003EE55292
MTIFLILGAIAAFYLIWILFRLAAFALPIYAGVWLGLLMQASGFGYPASITSGLAAGAALLLAAQLLIAFSPLLRCPVVLLFVVPVAFAGYQIAGGLAGQTIEPGIWASVLPWIGAFMAATGAWMGLATERLVSASPDSTHRRMPKSLPGCAERVPSRRIDVACGRL